MMCLVFVGEFRCALFVSSFSLGEDSTVGVSALSALTD